MYFGYGQIWLFAFVPVGFAIVMAASVALGFVFLVGPRRGGRAAVRYTSSVLGAFVLLSALDVAWATVTGRLAAFARAYGYGPLLEMIVLALLCVGSLGLMAMSYATTKAAEKAQEGERE